MELRSLRTFVAVAETGSFRKAARLLGVSQPALTRQIQGLEDDLGVRVFDRTRRPTTLTEAGASMLAIASNVLRELDPEHLRMATGATEHLRIGVPPWGYAYIPRLIKAFEQRYGHVPLELQGYTAMEVLPQLDSGEVDAAFRFMVPTSNVDETRLRLLPLMRERYGIVLPPGHPLACRSELCIVELADEEFILSDLYAFQREAIERAMQGSGRRPKVTIQARQELMMSLVEAGLGVGITTPTVARLAKFNVAFVPVAGEFLAVELMLAWSAQRQPGGALRKFIEFARANIGLIAAQP